MLYIEKKLLIKKIESFKNYVKNNFSKIFLDTLLEMTQSTKKYML